MDFKCDECEQSFTRKYRLKVHKLYKHAAANTLKRKHADVDDGIPITTMSKRDLLVHQVPTAISESFKFNHPFGMLVAGPTQSGKTQWTVKFLKERHQRIDPPVDGILFCYSEWQVNYDTLKREVPTTQFHNGIPTLDTLKSLQNVILVIDDLMEEAIKDTNIMNMFTVGSHHRNISVLFLMQNIFQKGTHARTISTNIQYMVLFKNARDQTQIRTLAMQVFPTNWNDFLTYYGRETNKEYGHVVLDFHPQTSNNNRIVKFYENEPTASNDENANDQQYIVQPQQKDDEKSEQQLHDTFQTEQQQNPIMEVNDIFVKNKEDQEHSVVKDVLTKQQHVLETIQQSILDLKQETTRSKIEGDVRVRDFQNKQKHDLELVKQSLFDLKQSSTSSRDQSEHQVDMVESNGAKKKVKKYNKNADEEKLMQIFRDHGCPTVESSDEETVIDWTSPL